MTMGRPRTPIGSYGSIAVRRVGKARYRATARYRDLDGRLREVKATARSATGASALLKTRLQDRSGYRGGGILLLSPFGDLVPPSVSARRTHVRSVSVDPIPSCAAIVRIASNSLE
jgi:hypothetical protein